MTRVPPTAFSVSLRARPTPHRLLAEERPAWARLLACIVCLIAFWSPLGTAASAAVKQHNVLVLYSNGRLLPANVEVDRALVERFAARADLSVALASEFLDSPRFGGEALRARHGRFPAREVRRGAT